MIEIFENLLANFKRLVKNLFFQRLFPKNILNFNIRRCIIKQNEKNFP